MSHKAKALSMFDPTLVKPAIVDSFKKLDPRVQWRNPVMFVVYVGSILTTVLFFQALGGQGEAPAGFILAVSRTGQKSRHYNMVETSHAAAAPNGQPSGGAYDAAGTGGYGSDS